MTLNSLNPCKSSCSHHSIDTGLTLKRLLPPSYDVFKDKIAPNCSHVSWGSASAHLGKHQTDKNRRGASRSFSLFHSSLTHKATAIMARGSQIFSLRSEGLGGHSFTFVRCSFLPSLPSCSLWSLRDPKAHFNSWKNISLMLYELIINQIYCIPFIVFCWSKVEYVIRSHF